MEDEPHLAALVLPALDLRSADGEALPEIGAAIGGKQLEQVESSAEHPDRHDVRVCVVVEAGCRRGRVRVVVLVGTHHAADLVAVERAVVAGDRAPEARDLDDQLRPEAAQEAEVAGDLVVLPDVVGDRGVDVPLQRGIVGDPAPRAGVQVSALRLLPSVAAALPGEHRTVVARLLRGPPRLSQPPVAVAKQRAGESRQPQVEEREDEELVPEDVAAVGLSVQAAGRHARRRSRQCGARRSAGDGRRGGSRCGSFVPRPPRWRSRTDATARARRGRACRAAR